MIRRWRLRNVARHDDVSDPCDVLDPAPGDQLTQLLVMREWLQRNAADIEHAARAEDALSQRAAYYAGIVTTLRDVAGCIGPHAFEPSADGYLPAFVSPLTPSNRRPWKA